jgi:hypothetical protein
MGYDTYIELSYIGLNSSVSFNQEDDEGSSAGEEDGSESGSAKNSDSFNMSSPNVSSPSVCRNIYFNTSLSTNLSMCLSFL